MIIFIYHMLFHYFLGIEDGMVKEMDETVHC